MRINCKLTIGATKWRGIKDVSFGNLVLGQIESGVFTIWPELASFEDAIMERMSRRWRDRITVEIGIPGKNCLEQLTDRIYDRAHNPDGTFTADDKSTPDVDESRVYKKKAVSKKAVSKKAVSKKKAK